MTIFGAMRTSVSGMNAQSSRLSALSQNVANADTVGYKASNARFSTLLDGSTHSGGVSARVGYNVSEQGLLQSTSSGTDLAIQGNGFFVVTDGHGSPVMTRAGSFLADASGHLVNTAGYQLMGINMAGGTGTISGSGLDSLTPVTISTSGLVATPSTKGQLTINARSTAPAVAAAKLPSTNAADATYTSKTSVVAYDNLGGKVTLDVYISKTGDNAWEATVYNAADAHAGGGFPYAAGPMTTQSLAFSPMTGKLTSGGALSIAIPNGNTIALDMSASTQLAADFAVTGSSMDGSAPSAFSKIQIDQTGVVSAVYQNGATVPKFRIALATVPGVDNLTPMDGNAFTQNAASGAPILGAPGGAGMGSIFTSALESSTVDIATELTDMIQTQRSYTANSKAFQIGTDMADTLVNLKV